jgi:hypothetical protein
MADVYAVFGVLLALGIAFPGMLTAVWLLFPERVEHSRMRIMQTPGRCLGLGMIVAFLFGIPIIIFVILPFGPAKLIGGIILTLVLALSTLGAAGLTFGMAVRLRENSDGKINSVPAFIGSAIALELAAFFPFIGWFFVIPLGMVVSLGATTFALFQWVPREKQAPKSTQEIIAESQGL